MANDPADVGCGPIDLARLRVIDVWHAPVQCHRMSTIVTDDALWLAGGSRGVEDIEWIGRLDRDRGKLLRAIMRCMPFDITPFNKGGGDGLTLIDDAGTGLCRARVMASSRSGLYSTILLGSCPQDALIIACGWQSSMRLASSAAANPPKTTEWTAPRRAQPSMAITASGIIGI